ncbi:dihydrofolate reductase family protein [Chelativorans composti]|mgnify:CR=1 FL=1|jgi:dihydrofolate reductase|uniref:Dihydrofolate reductase family protein n=1 Tax=Chelativorans composti TaxID=768533 RepID=A0ABW5DE45_9HYPH
MPPQLVRVQHFAISLDGFGTGVGQSLEQPFGHAGERLHGWMKNTRWARPLFGLTGGSAGIDDALLRTFDVNIGAEIMGANKFGPPGWHENPDWKGWWGDNPPFHTPVFVLTHHPRPSIAMEGGTIFHFLNASPEEALAEARKAAGGKDVRIGGGVKTVRSFLEAGLINHMHIVLVPVVLGRGERLWEGLEDLEKDFDIEATSSPSGVTHLMFMRKG